MDYKPYLAFALFGVGIMAFNLIGIYQRERSYSTVFTEPDYTGTKIGGTILGLDLLAYLVMLYLT